MEGEDFLLPEFEETDTNDRATSYTTLEICEILLFQDDSFNTRFRINLTPFDYFLKDRTNDNQLSDRY